MGSEIVVLCLAGFLHYVATFLTGRSQDKDMGHDYNISPRDKPAQYSVHTKRLQRAQRNHAENLMLFTAAVVAVMWSGSDGVITAACAWIYLAARVLYIPAYYYGWAPWRSIIFLFGSLATLAMFVAALF
ncbi:MAPEG family protein [Falsirhodobacter halotolerans]|uniref:MAPEG family protein n=1 Tax=Falsirhodobacter halotolerans TaxID=1146892 RepID=UPI001FD471D1|nr:MAPEG family protein [Falsirhodobacter halotolerans]MCJ8140434.1 MAPEG family protein [Falsirhodobacter halotolerans]